MRSPIPPAIREELSQDAFMSRCCLEGIGLCDGRIEWHHALRYASKRINELYSILPLCHYHHVHEAAFGGLLEGHLRDRIKHFHAEEEFKRLFPKSSLL